MDAGAKLRQAALERIQEDKKKSEAEEAVAVAAAASKKKAEEEAAAAAKKKAEEEEEAAKKAQEEKKKQEAAASKPKSLSALLSKQLTLAEDEKTATTTEVDTSTASIDKSKRRVYSKEEMLRLKSLPVCMTRPADLPEFVITKGPSRSADRGDRGDRRRNQGGNGGNWQRGSAPPQRQRGPQADGNNRRDGGGQWARGQAPPPKRNNPNQKGGRGGPNQGPFFDGPVAPLVKSQNGWRPKKNTSPGIIAEKKVKSILNKMTKEKFDRLATQMCEIPVSSHEILTIMIHNVYEKAIDEPAFGDMYGDLCAKLSQHVQSNSFVKIIESDEEPPTEDGTTGGGGAGAPSANATFRWSNDVNTSDSELVGPFASVEECLDTAMSESEQSPVDRGEMELELVKLQIKNGMFIKIMKKQSADEGEDAVFYTVFFPVSEAAECGQQLSKIFLSEPECVSDATKQNSFKRSLLNKCEDEFNKQDIYVDWKKEKQAYDETKSTLTEREQKEKEEDMDFRRMKIKKQMLGNIKFIGQLYKKNLLKEKIMRFCIASLLKLESNDGKKFFDSGDTEMDEEDHEAICNMFTTIGLTIDRSPAADFMKVCFTKIKKLSTDNQWPARSRFMYKDLIELRANKWVPRRKVEKAKTLDEIRKDVEREERLQAQQSQQNYRGGGRNDYRRDNRGGGGYGGDRSNQGGGNRQRQSKPAAQIDDDGFTTIIGGGGGGGKGNKSPSKGPRQQVRTRQSFAALSEEASKARAPAPAAPEPLSREKLERRVKTIRSEYMQDPNNLEELLLSFDELSGTPDAGTQFVSFNSDRIIDCKDNERKAIYAMLKVLVEKGKLSSANVKAGLVDLIEFIDSYVYDAPKAFDYLGEMLSTMLLVNALDIPWICEQAEKTKVSSDDNPEKIIRALAGAIEASKGKDEVKSLFVGGSTKSVETLLADKWAVVSKDIL